MDDSSWEGGMENNLIICVKWTIASQAPLSMEFSRQEYWSGLLFPISDLPKGEGNLKKKKKKEIYVYL